MNNNCVQDVSAIKQISFKDKHSSSLIVLNNLSPPVKILKFQIDGCWAGEEDKKCDYKLSIHQEDVCTQCYIELKGTDYTKALMQIEKTLNLFPNERNDKKFGLIALSKVKNVDIRSTKAQLLEKRLKQQHKMTIQYKCSPARYCLTKQQFVN